MGKVKEGFYNFILNKLLHLRHKEPTYEKYNVPAAGMP